MSELGHQRASARRSGMSVPTSPALKTPDVEDVRAKITLPRGLA